MSTEAEDNERDVMNYILEDAPLSYRRLSPDERRVDARALIELARLYENSTTARKLRVIADLRSMIFYLADEQAGVYWRKSQDETEECLELTANC